MYTFVVGHYFIRILTVQVFDDLFETGAISSESLANVSVKLTLL